MAVKTAQFYRRMVGSKIAIEDQSVSTGSRFWVHAGTGTDGTAYGSTPDKPYATVDYAVAACTASKGDRIMVLPGHTEALTEATSLTMDVAGVQVIGIGSGRLKPQISITTATTATWNITAANCLVQNIDIVTGFLDVAVAMTVGAAGDGLTLDGVNFYDTSATAGALIGMSVAAAVSDVTIKNCNYYGIALSAAATEAFIFAGEANRLNIENCYIKGEFSGNVIDAATAASIDVILKHLLLINMSETGGGVDLKAETTGMATDVQAYLEDHAGSEVAITGAALSMTDTVRQTNVVTASPFLCIAIDT
jgi:hypothetical protein